MTHSGNFLSFIICSRKSAKMLVHFGIYNPVFVCQHARSFFCLEKTQFSFGFGSFFKIKDFPPIGL